MKLTHKYIFLITIGVLPFLFSCKKDFLDLKPSGALPANGSIRTDADLNTIANGMYAGLRSVVHNVNSVPTTYTLYGRTLPIKGDLAADNVYLKTNNSGRYLSFRDYNQTAANAEAAEVWIAAYDVNKRANTVINSDIASTEVVDQLKGEALAIRALMHFELVRNFARPYTVDANGLGVPIVTEYSQSAKPARNSTAEVYAQIVSDLNEAYSLMTLNQGEDLVITSTNTSRNTSSAYFSKYAAKALLARVYQHMGDWANARDAALDVINNSGFSLVPAADYVSYWANPASTSNRVETIFEVSSDAASNLSSNSLSNFYSLEGYGDAWVTDELYNLYSDNDVRKDVIIVSPSGGRDVYLVNKYPNTSNPADKDDTKVLRYADVLLILAEAYANLGDDASARQWLNEVVKNRVAGFAGYTSSGAQLKADIITERRKEFAFEGYRYWDLMRLNLPITNHTKSQNPLVVTTIAVDDTRRIFPIPQAELDVNENIRGQQNPCYQ